MLGYLELQEHVHIGSYVWWLHYALQNDYAHCYTESLVTQQILITHNSAWHCLPHVTQSCYAWQLCNCKVSKLKRE